MKHNLKKPSLSLISFLILLILILNTTNLATSIPDRSTSVITALSKPIILDSSVNPTKVQPGDTMTVTASVFDISGVEKVEARFYHEKGFDTVILSMVSGSKYIGSWNGNWEVHDTLVKEYITTVTAFSGSGISSSINLTWYDPVPWWDMDWGYRKKITLDSGQVPGDLTNFPVLINITDSNLSSKAQSNGNDIAFADDSGTKLNHEIEYFDGSTGELVAWVNVTSLSSSYDTEIYMYYNNSGCINQENIESVWDVNFSLVYHLNETDIDNGAGDIKDSTANNHDGRTSDMDPTDHTNGIVGSAMVFDGINDYIDTSFTEKVSDGVYSLFLWVKDIPSGNKYVLCQHDAASGYSSDFILGYQNGGFWGDGATVSGSNTIADGSWHQLGFTIETGSPCTSKLYLDGKYIGTAAGPTPDALGLSVKLMSQGNGAGSYCAGKADELRISNTLRNASWITTEYNNVINATNGGFYTLGTEEIATPSKPQLKPIDSNNCTLNIRPTFGWYECDNTNNYTLYVDSESDFSSVNAWNVTKIGQSNTSHTATESQKLSSEGRWYWKVVANNSNGENTSDVWSFIFDITPPSSVNLSSPSNGSSTDSNSVTFSWNATIDNAVNVSGDYARVSNIACYQLQVDNNSDFSSLLVNENTSDNTTLSLTKTVSGKLYWRVRAWDQAGNHGSWLDNRTLTVFSYSISSSETTLQIKKGTSGTSTINLSHTFGDVENVRLNNSWSGGNTPSGITVSFSTEEAPVSFDSVVTIDCGGSATTGSYTCVINGTSTSGINRSISIDITVYSMLFSLDVFPRSIFLIRSDEAIATASVGFDQGALNTVTLSGAWIDGTPSGISVEYNPSSGTPNFDSTLTFTTSKSAEAGSYVYRITGTSAGLSKVANMYIDISKNMSLTVTTDKSSYEKGQEIQISGTAKDPEGNTVNSGTATITLSAQNWSDTLTTSISNGAYNTNYYITFDKPNGDWTVSATATDSHGHETSSPITTSMSIESPENYEHYYINVISPPTGQLFKRGNTVTFTISLVDENDVKIQGADVKACFSSDEEIVFSEGSPGVYSSSYDLGYNCQIGNLSLYVEGKKYEDEKLKAGFHYIDFKVTSVKPVIELIEPKAGELIETGETLIIKIKALYPDGSPVQEGIITAIGPDGEELIFIRSEEAGIYVASYTPTAENLGSWTLQITVEDAYSNSAVLNGGQIDVVQSKILTLLQRYWWATIAVILIITTLIGYIGHIKLRKVRFSNLKDEIIELEQLKKRNAVMYFSKGEIARETYDRLSQEYESKITRLSKKERMLDRKISKTQNGKNKRWKNGREK